MTLNFTVLSQLWSLITSRHAFRWSWNFQKLMQVRYTLDLRTFQVKILPPEITKTWEFAILGGNLGAWEPIWISMVFYDFVDFWNCQLLPLENEFLQKFWTINAHNKFTIKHWEKICMKFVEGFSGLFCINITWYYGNLNVKCLFWWYLLK